jgi:uncharacterized protein YecA (UPF0149 family)
MTDKFAAIRSLPRLAPRLDDASQEASPETSPEPLMSDANMRELWQQAFTPRTKTIPRNKPCPGGAKKKYKKCCLGKT